MQSSDLLVPDQCLNSSSLLYQCRVYCNILVTLQLYFIGMITMLYLLIFGLRNLCIWYLFPFLFITGNIVHNFSESSCSMAVHNKLIPLVFQYQINTLTFSDLINLQIFFYVALFGFLYANVYDLIVLTKDKRRQCVQPQFQFSRYLT